MNQVKLSDVIGAASSCVDTSTQQPEVTVSSDHTADSTVKCKACHPVRSADAKHPQTVRATSARRPRDAGQPGPAEVGHQRDGPGAQQVMPQLPEPNEPLSTMVNFGTRSLTTAWIVSEPCLMAPPCSAAAPTMKPVVFCRKTSGVPDWSQSWMNWAALVEPCGWMGRCCPGCRPGGRGCRRGRTGFRCRSWP